MKAEVPGPIRAGGCPGMGDEGSATYLGTDRWKSGKCQGSLCWMRRLGGVVFVKYSEGRLAQAGPVGVLCMLLHPARQEEPS